MNRIHNFSAGPAVLPLSVLEQAREDIVCYQDSGIGVMELSHRSKEFEEIIYTAESNIRKLLKIPDNYEVLFCTGGATQQFSAVAQNLMLKTTPAGYAVTGIWSEKALEEGSKFGPTKTIASSKESNYRYIPEIPALDEPLAYLHITSNNTIFGTQYQSDPTLSDLECPLVCDASSDLLNRPVDVSKYGLIYASAQKNLGTAGVTVVIIRKDLLDRCSKELALMTNYRTFASSKSLYNTPPTFSIYILKLVTEWIESLGGLSKIKELNQQKANLIYDLIDSNDFYQGHAHKESRSVMNVTFTLRDKSLDQKFLKESELAKLSGLSGHRLVGGFRASMYNALPIESITALRDFMVDFRNSNG